MTYSLANVNSDATPPRVRNADTDDQLVALWLHGRSRHTQRAYQFGADAFRAQVAKPLRIVTLGDVQGFADALTARGLAPASCGRRLAAVKSLLAFAHKIGYLAFDVGRVVSLPPCRETLSERILDECEVHRLLAGDPNPRNQTMLLLLYAAGLRVSELCGLRWRDLQAREDGGQITVFGKGGKTRVIRLPRAAWDAISSMPRGEGDSPLFASRRGGHLDPSRVWRIVRAAATTAGLSRLPSPHYLRHAHASHALDRGAPIHLVQQTLGHSNISTTGRYLHARPAESSGRFLPL